MAAKRPSDWPAGVEGPLAELERIRSELESLFHKFETLYLESSSSETPAVEVTEDEQCFHVRVELPGCRADEIDISASRSTLFVSVERETSTVEQGSDRLSRTSKKDSIQRTLRLSKEIDPDRIQGQYRKGVLSITLPKTDPSGRKKISIVSED